MNHTANRPARAHGIPFVFQAAAAILFAAAMFGLWQSHKPAGPATMTLLNFIGATCPAALPTRSGVTVKDGAYALNRWTYAQIADQIDPNMPTRCVSRPRPLHSSRATQGSGGATEHARHGHKKAAPRRRK